MLTFIHAADLHLDSPFAGLKEVPKSILKDVQQSTFRSLAHLVQTAIHNQVDFVLFSGDIYDLEDRSVKAQVQFKKEMERLNNYDIPVYIIHGNHDFIGDETLHLELPSNVKIFSETVETIYLTTKRGSVAAISGFSYNKRWISERMIEQYPKKSPKADYQIGLLHGFQEGMSSEHAHYAPFTVNELREKQYDYWALGHIHAREKISDFPLAYYPGNLQGRNKKETGEKGYLLVELNKQGSAQVQFISSAPIIWQKLTVNAVQDSSMDACYKAIQEALPKTAQKHYLISLELVVSEDISDALLKKISQSEFVDVHQYLENDHFVWITDYKVATASEEKGSLDLESLFPEAWNKVIEEVKEEELFNELTSDFFNQSKFASVLQERSEYYRQEMIEKALTELQATSSVKGADRIED